MKGTNNNFEWSIIRDKSVELITDNVKCYQFVVNVDTWGFRDCLSFCNGVYTNNHNNHTTTSQKEMAEYLCDTIVKYYFDKRI